MDGLQPELDPDGSSASSDKISGGRQSGRVAMESAQTSGCRIAAANSGRRTSAGA